MCEPPDHDESREESGDERGFLGATELDLVQNERHNGLLGSTGTQEGTHTSGSGRRLSTEGQRAAGLAGRAGAGAETCLRPSCAETWGELGTRASASRLF